jgi:AcrR family transcriptional regulator
MAKKTLMRAVPQQERGQKRIDRLLEAAAKLFAKVGYEETTTNAIAREARTSIGSLYQFFPNKEALLHALADRYLRELRAVQDSMLGEDAIRLPLPELYDRIIQSIAGFHATHPGFQQLFFGSTTSKHLAAAADQLKQQCVDRVDALMAARNPEIDPTHRRILATLNVEIIKTLMPLAQAADPPTRQRLLAETKMLLLSHTRETLATYGIREESKNSKSDPRQISK